MTAILNGRALTNERTTGGHPLMAGISFAPDALEDLRGADVERLTAVALTFHHPALTAPAREGHGVWYTRGELALIVVGGQVLRVLDRPEVDPPPRPELPTPKPNRATRRAKGHRGGRNVPTDSIELLARCKRAGLTVEETNKGGHWKITRPGWRGPRTKSGAVFVSSTSNPREMAENVGRIVRETGVDVRKVGTRADNDRREKARKRRRHVTAGHFPDVAALEGGPSRREAAARVWIRTPETTGTTTEQSTTDERESAMTMTTLDPPGQLEQQAPEQAPEQGSGEQVSDEQGADLLLARALNALAASPRDMPQAERTAAILRYVNAARALDQRDVETARKLHMKPNALSARITVARAQDHPLAPARLKGSGDGGARTAAKMRERGERRLRRTGRADHQRTMVTRSDQATAVDEWLATHGEPEPEQPAGAAPEAETPTPEVLAGLGLEPEPEPALPPGFAASLAATAQAAGLALLEQHTRPDAEPEPEADVEPEDDGSSYGSLRDLGEVLLAQAGGAAALTDDGPTYTLDEAAAAVAASTYTLDEVRAEPEPEPSPAAEVEVARVPEWVAVTEQRHTDMAAVLAEVREVRAMVAEARAAAEPVGPVDVLAAALTEVGAEVTAAQLRRARVALADRGWTLEITGRV